MTNTEFNEYFRERTKEFALRILEFLEDIPNTTTTRVMAYQLTKAGTSVGANFRAFCRGRSNNERFAKVCIVVEEADETLFWLELLGESDLVPLMTLERIYVEAEEILKVMASYK